MNTPPPLPGLDQLKAQAKRLRDALERNGEPVGHSRSLEILARQYGFRDWNTLHAAVGNRPPGPPVALGDRVRGSYLGQAFEGEVIGVEAQQSAPDRFRVTLRFDDPVDVVTFDSFSNFRQRVSCVIDAAGATAEKTSDGRPQLQLSL